MRCAACCIDARVATGWPTSEVYESDRGRVRMGDVFGGCDAGLEIYSAPPLECKLAGFELGRLSLPCVWPCSAKEKS